MFGFVGRDKLHHCLVDCVQACIGREEIIGETKLHIGIEKMKRNFDVAVLVHKPRDQFTNGSGVSLHLQFIVRGDETDLIFQQGSVLRYLHCRVWD